MKKKLKHCLGIYDAFTAMAAESAGMEMLFVDGLGASASLFGSADAGLVTLTEMAALVRRIAGSVSIPVWVDGRAGYGGVHNVQRTVQEFEAAGAAGVVLGDNAMSASDMVLRLTAALAARKKRSFKIVARAARLESINLALRTGSDGIFIQAESHELPVLRLEKMGYDIVVHPIESLLAAAETVRVLASTVLGRAETVEKRRPHGSRR